MRSANGIRALVCGTLGGSTRQAGLTWVVLQYVLGLERLGCDVVLIEPLKGSALPEGSLARSAAATWFHAVVQRFGLAGQSALLHEAIGETIGLSYAELRQAARQADLLLNLSGSLTDEELLGAVRRRVYVDLDPAFTQLWNDLEGIDMGFTGHDRFVTLGQTIGTADCPVPTCGISWVPMLPPVVLQKWPVARYIERDALTTVANWRGYGSIRVNGTLYGQKAHSLRPLIDLPERVGERFELALGIHPDETADLTALRRHGWHIVDPLRVVDDPDAYWGFIRGSKAEFGIAKSGYVLSRCGWFSDRSACYLAAGRPVIAQDTGLRGCLPTGEGLFTFSTPDEVAAAVDALAADYDRHARAARALAEAYLDSDQVLARMLSEVA